MCRQGWPCTHHLRIISVNEKKVYIRLTQGVYPASGIDHLTSFVQFRETNSEKRLVLVDHICRYGIDPWLEIFGGYHYNTVQDLMEGERVRYSLTHWVHGETFGAVIVHH